MYRVKCGPRKRSAEDVWGVYRTRLQVMMSHLLGDEGPSLKREAVRIGDTDMA